MHIGCRVYKPTVLAWPLHWENPWLLTIDLWCCSWGVPIFGFGARLFEVLVRPSRFHVFEGVFCSKFGVYDPVLVDVVCSAPTVNAFLCCACTPWGSLDLNSQSVDAFGRAFIVLLVDLGLTDDLDRLCLQGPLYLLSMRSRLPTPEPSSPCRGV